MVKIVYPTLDDKGESIGQHFGRVPYYAWFEVKEGKVIDQGVIPNDSEHFGGVGLPPERIGRLHPDVMIVLGMGGRAIAMFQDMNIAVLQATPLREGRAERAHPGLPSRALKKGSCRVSREDRCRQR